MTVESELAAWAATRPDWQQEVLLRLCRDEVITPADIEALADRVIKSEPAATSPLAASDIPGHASAGGGVQLTSLHDLVGVNALVTGQRLTFGAPGVTIVYGDNASGKSGYARILKSAVGARTSPDILGDVYAKAGPTSIGATIEYQVAGQVGEWKWSDAPSPLLRQIHYYDEADGEVYLGADSEITYRPSALTLLDGLVTVCDAIRAVLNKRLGALEAARPPLPAVPSDTPAAGFLAGLNADTAPPAIVSACTAPADAKEQLGKLLSEEARLKSSDPGKERDRLATLAGDLSEVAAQVEKLSEKLGRQSYSEMEGLRQSATQLRAAAAVASSRDFSSEPVPGVGSETWRELWVAARTFSQAKAYHGHPFPATGEQDRCVLCHQVLTAEAGNRLQRFQAFMTDTTERDAAKAEADLAATRKVVAELVSSLPASVASAQARAVSAGEDDAEVARIWMETATERLKSVVAYLDGGADAMPEPLDPGPAAALRARAAELRNAAVEIDANSFAEQLGACSKSAAKLQGQVTLASAVSAVMAEFDRLKSKAKIEAAKRATDTGAITRKASELTRDYVTREVRDQFTRESERLRLRRTTLNDTSSKKGRLLHRPALLGASGGASVCKVLSEGEQTALGLSGLFTEVVFDDTKSAVILDDPVTSLDHQRRSLVARRLVDLAADRQVVVFTHELTFVGDLVRHAAEAGVAVTERWIQRCGGVPGTCRDKHPWKARDVRSRIAYLRTELVRIKRECQDWDEGEYEKQTAEWAGELSETWERAVNMEIVNEVVDRGTSQVRPLKFRILAKITSKDDAEFQAGYGQASTWARRHDKAPEVNYMPPEFADMEQQLQHLNQWYERIKQYRG
jgi:hypothetical protein